MIKKQSWEDFRKTGLLLFVNHFLHIFGWALVFEIENDEVKNVYPARVGFRGFDEKSTEEAYRNLSQFMEDNAKALNVEAKQ